jgi:hypothetical protein
MKHDIASKNDKKQDTVVNEFLPKTLKISDEKKVKECKYY